MVFRWRVVLLCVLGFMGLIFSSCGSSKKLTYFNNQKDSTISSGATIPQSFIQNNDLLGISISSLNPEASALFNAPNLSYANTSSAANGGTLQSSGYLVNADGNIQFPFIGDIKVTGMTTDQLRKQITKELVNRKLLVDPIVNIRYLNFKVTVMGEVGHPTVINVLNEKISLLEALGLAGDITIYGKKDNVMIIREENGDKTIKRVNLNSSEIFTSQYYYLKSNDIVYVEPTKARVASSGRAGIVIPIVLSALSFIAIIVAYEIKN